MAQKTNSFERFWKELKRRKVVHVITVYAAVAFVILQVTNMVTRPLRLPDWTEAFVIFLLCIGFIISVFVSWVYDITPAGVKKTKPVSAVKHVDQAIIQTSSGWKIATYVSGVLIVALVAFNFISRRNLNADISKFEKSIAVLPFRNDSRDSTNQYFINGIMEKITTNLQMVKTLRVLSRTSVEQYRNTTKSVPDIARELKVNYILEGSGQKYGNSFNITVQLIKAKGKETHLWAKPYDQEINEVKDYIKVQSQIAQAIVTELKAVINPEEKQLIEKIPTANLTAYDFYQRGREEEGKYSYYDITASSPTFTFGNPSTIKALERAEKMYKAAKANDSTFALAYTGLAGIYWSKNFYREYFSEHFLDSVLFLANKALSFDDQLPDAYYIRGMYYGEKGIIKKALEDFDKTLKLNPNYWLAYYGKGTFYFIEEDYEMAIENFQQTVSHYHGSGLSEVLRRICFTFWMSGFNELANNYNIEAVKLEPDSVNYYYWLYMFDIFTQKGLKFLEKGYSIDSNNISILEYLADYNQSVDHFKEATKFFIKYLERSKALGITRVNNHHRIGYTYWKCGLKDSAAYYFNKQIEYCNDAIRLGRPYGVKYAYYDLAGVYAFMGNKIKAYENIKIFSQKGGMAKWAADLVKTDPLFNSIRNEPEFQQIIRDMEAKYQAEHERVRKWLEERGML